MCHTEDKERLAQLETEFLTTLYISYAHQSNSQFACCICSHCFSSGLFREEKVTLITLPSPLTLLCKFLVLVFNWHELEFIFEGNAH